MYPDYTTDDQKRVKKMFWLAGIVLVMIFVALLALTFRPKEKFEQAWLHNTNFTSGQSTLYLNGSTLYSYNGLAFFSVNTQNRTIRTLSTGYKLPTPDKVYWANDKGALLTFKWSFYDSRIQTELQKRGLPLDPNTTEKYTWYLDFATNKFKLVTTKPVGTDLAYFSAKDNGFYYIVTGDAPALHFYNIGTLTDSNLVAKLNTTDMTSLSVCGNKKICFIARDISVPGNQRLYGVDQNNILVHLYNSRGHLFATNQPNRYVTLVNSASNQATSEDDTGYSNEPASLYNVADGSTRKLGFTVSAPISLHFRTDDEFYVFNDSLTTSYNGKDGVPAYQVGRLKGTLDAKTAILPLLTSDGKPFTGKLITTTSQSGNNQSLIFSTDQGPYLFSFDHTDKNLPTADPISASKTVDSCIKNAGLSDKDYYSDTSLYRIIFNDEPGFEKKITAFSTCLVDASNPPLIGYNYSFLGTDSKSGKIVTD